jgi:hypothetical protein
VWKYFYKNSAVIKSGMSERGKDARKILCSKKRKKTGSVPELGRM